MEVGEAISFSSRLFSSRTLTSLLISGATGFPSDKENHSDRPMCNANEEVPDLDISGRGLRHVPILQAKLSQMMLRTE
jgi:hypothetical protein